MGGNSSQRMKRGKAGAARGVWSKLTWSTLAYALPFTAILAATIASLLSRQENIDAALILMASHGHANAVKALIAAGAAVDSRDVVHGAPALHWAVGNRHIRVARVLLAAGASASTKDGGGACALITGITAAGTGDEADFTKMLIAAGADVDATDAGGHTALHAAATLDLVEAARALMEAGANLELRDGDGQTALQAAERRGHAEVARVLMGAST